MKKILSKTYLRTLIIVLIISIGVIVFVPRQKLSDIALSSTDTSLQTSPPVIAPRAKVPPQKINFENKAPLQYIILTAGDTSVQIPFSSGNTLYNALLSAKANGLLSFAGSQYPGLGFFATDIGSLHQGNGKFLIYYVNGIEASVGVSSYIVKNGDTIVWKLQ